jgi:hypothetical protein
MSYSNAYVEKTPKKRKVWLDEESYREVPIKNKEHTVRRYRNEPSTQSDMVGSHEGVGKWKNY